MWLGKYKNRKEKLYNLKWPRTPIFALGVAFSYNNQIWEQENLIYEEQDNGNSEGMQHVDAKGFNPPW